MPQTYFEYITSTQNLFKSWEKFRRGKRGRPDVLEFERRLEENIFELQTELRNGLYRHGSYQPFTVWDPKQRRIHKASVRDRLVHQAVVSVIEPLFERQFIYDSFSCRINKGTHAGVARLRRFLRTVGNSRQEAWALKCDISQFFASVDHEMLKLLIKRQITDKRTLRLLEEAISSYQTASGKGIPLGNLTSQLFANVYMHQFDWFIKHQLRLKHYIRYCDDFVIVHSERQYLLRLIVPIKEFLGEELGLQLHPHKVSLRKWRQGIDFLGYVVKPDCILLRTKTKRRLLNRATARNLDSYLGVLSHADSYELRQLAKIKAYDNSNNYAFSRNV